MKRILLSLILISLFFMISGENKFSDKELHKNVGDKTQEDNISSTSNNQMTEIKSDVVYELVKVSDYEYYVYLFDENGNKFEEVYSPVEPGITINDSGYIEITISIGSTAHYSIFVDLSNKRISSPIFNYVGCSDEKIAYFSENQLIIADLFNNQVVYVKIERNFSPTATSPVSKVEFIDTNLLFFEYLEGNEYDIRTETVDISN